MQVFGSESVDDDGNLPLGIVAGLAAAIVSAIAWAAITAATNFQIGFMAVGVGFAVAYAVRFGGRGHDGRFAVASAIIALCGCLLGNFLTVVVVSAPANHLTYLEQLNELLPHVVYAMSRTFQFMDVIFYAIGTYFGFKYATTPLRPRVVAPEQAP